VRACVCVYNVYVCERESLCMPVCECMFAPLSKPVARTYIFIQACVIHLCLLSQDV